MNLEPKGARIYWLHDILFLIDFCDNVILRVKKVEVKSHMYNCLFS